MMIKKIIASVALVATVAVSAAMFAAFEAHVINVTAKIENALGVSTEHIDFGTVFPQEKHYKDLCIFLSDSFIAEDRVMDVEYVIKQKPKVKPTDESGQNPDGDPYKIIIVEEDEFEGPAHEYCLGYIPADQADLEDVYFTYCYPNLSPYLSKHKNANDKIGTTDMCGEFEYDCEVDAPNPNWATDHATGYLLKDVDEEDRWVIDLVVPGFKGMTDQGYDPAEFGMVLDPRLEHQVFGTDLWVEVTGISLNCPGGYCEPV